MARKNSDLFHDGLASPVDKECPGCGSGKLHVFYRQKNVPVHSVLLMETREKAVNYPRGELALGFCGECGFITNTAYDPALNEYSPRCEETQGFSGTFNAFARTLAEGLVERYDLRSKDIIEIGCGKGEFLSLLCELGGNRGVGFDPAYAEHRLNNGKGSGIKFIQDFYSEEYSGYKGDFIVCKMTLEHIPGAARMLKTVRNSIGNRPGTIAFFQIPDMTRILNGLAFWDIYYEHCSYFTPGSLTRVLKLSGFDTVDIRRDFDGQYIMCEARPSGVKRAQGLAAGEDLATLMCAVRYFAENHMQKIAIWKHKLSEFKHTGYRCVLWGSGSKGVSFLTTLGITDEVQYAVDINPRRHGTFMAGTGHEIIPPARLRTYKPDVVIVMNPVYTGEITTDLRKMGLASKVITV